MPVAKTGSDRYSTLIDRLRTKPHNKRTKQISTDLTNVILLAFALAFDAFAVAIAVGIRMGNLDRWTVFRLSWHFGFAQFGMPIVGWYAGGFISSWIGSLGHWLAAVVLFAIGSRAIYEQLRSEQQEWTGDPTRGAALIVLMFATSIDALAAGLSLALVGTAILNPALIIGVVAAGMTILGLSFGRALGLRFSRQAGILGGLILIALAIKTVW